MGKLLKRGLILLIFLLLVLVVVVFLVGINKQKDIILEGSFENNPTVYFPIVFFILLGTALVFQVKSYLIIYSTSQEGELDNILNLKGRYYRFEIHTVWWVGDAVLTIVSVAFSLIGFFDVFERYPISNLPVGLGNYVLLVSVTILGSALLVDLWLTDKFITLNKTRLVNIASDN